MRRIICSLLLLSSLQVLAQNQTEGVDTLNKEINEIHHWLSSSESVVLNDSIMQQIQAECEEKQIEKAVFFRNRIFIQALFNTQFDDATRIRIADMLLERYNDTLPKLPLDVVRETRMVLITKTKSK